VGGWGDQVVPDPIPTNVAIMGPVDDARDIYARTRILLMPSSYEPYGRVGLEAAASGIPTLASDVPGIREALGEAGTFLPVADVGAWVDAVRQLDDRQRYESASLEAAERSAASPEHDLERLETALAGLTRSP
jgi:glycosyltransferase involved in cell wall biosynthesis